MWHRVQPAIGRPTLVLALLAFGYLGLQLWLSRIGRSLAYDEAVYLSQVRPGAVVQPFTAPRARGLPWMLTPVAGASLTTIRIYLALLNSALLFFAFRAWLPILRWRAVAAAAIFGCSWLALFYGTEMFPNLLAAFGAVTAAGYLAQHLTPATNTVASRRRIPIEAALAVTFVALIRPTEATFLAAGLCLSAISRQVRITLIRWAALFAGLAFGWAPWVIESYQTFGGPLVRLRLASANVGGGFYPHNVLDHLALTDGPVSGHIGDGAPLLGWVWWTVIAVGVVYAVANLAARHQRGPAVAAITGMTSALQYLLFTSVLEARFLLPAYALFSIVVATLLPDWTASSERRQTGAGARGVVSVALVVTILATFGAWQIRALVGVASQQERSRQVAAQLAEELKRRTPTGRCYFVSQFAFPVISLLSGCKGDTYHPAERNVVLNDDTGGIPVYGLAATNPARSRLTPPAQSVQWLPTTRDRWWIFIVPPEAIRVAKG